MSGSTGGLGKGESAVYWPEGRFWSCSMDELDFRITELRVTLKNAHVQDDQEEFDTVLMELGHCLAVRASRGFQLTLPF
jgi:hypothetical protein